VKFLDALPVILDHFWDGVCYYICGHGAIERKGKSFEMNMWLVLVRSVEWKVFESFEIRVRGDLKSVEIAPVDVEPAIEWVVIVSKAGVTRDGSGKFEKGPMWNDKLAGIRCFWRLRLIDPGSEINNMCGVCDGRRWCWCWTSDKSRRVRTQITIFGRRIPCPTMSVRA